MVRKYAAAMLALLFALSLSQASVFAADAFTLELSAKEVKRGEEIAISGTVTAETGDVALKAISPNQTVLYIDVVPSVDGRYSATVTIPTDEDLAPAGVYTVTAGTGSLAASKTFTIPGSTGNPPGGGDGENPGHGGNSGGTGGTGSSNSGNVTVPPKETGIPSGAGQAAGSVVRPELTADGRYIAGSETLAEAMRQAADAVTIELPATAGDTGAALEFPAASLNELRDRNLDLIVTSGNRTVRFPVGSITAPNDRQALIRIVLKAAWTEEARKLVQQSIGSRSDYTSTGVVLSVVIQIVSGDQITEIHTLDKPAVVSMKLTEEQEQRISADLAGVYYADGKAIEYVPGQLRQGIFTFTADHFSYYAILEYSKTFADLTGHWAESAVKALAAKHLVNGVDERHYEPNRGITRAEFVTLVMRSIDYAGNAPAASSAAANPFQDVAAGRYYSEQVVKAAALDIVSGYNGAFRPDDPITREEAVVALVRAAQYFSLPESGRDEPAFADAKEISSWAAAAVNEAWTLGLIQGDGARFHPKHAVTRAEVAIMIHRLVTDRSL
ncbi:hypothetical protein PAE9249_02461 [Paenibacillus sp. CECT 9249]|uniref:S-layer homology domain-containing protein n=1 Tax=Paenibacillus sp. CECT 9249 TaxID=2845385 RepID=UPI001E41C665|nr:S-layer homology domain-containing protein [Paenibacillus sp. CECT 9249]CAH0119952.1 hypothetical protein PAE9249_02461 [Paenibacillus sp. CECT 9249]